MEECKCSTVQVDYQTEELYIVTIIIKYQKRGFNDNNNILYILLSDTIVLLVRTLQDFIQNGKVLVYEVMDNWNEM